MQNCMIKNFLFQWRQTKLWLVRNKAQLMQNSKHFTLQNKNKHDINKMLCNNKRIFQALSSLGGPTAEWKSEAKKR
jgi:hypothetical protein